MADRFRRSSCAGASARKLLIQWATAIALVLTASAGQVARAAEGGPTSQGGPGNEAVHVRGAPIKARHRTSSSTTTQSREGHISPRHHQRVTSDAARSGRNALRERHPHGSLPGHPAHEKGRIKGGHKKSKATEAHLKPAHPSAGLANKRRVHKPR